MYVCQAVAAACQPNSSQLELAKPAAALRGVPCIDAMHGFDCIRSTGCLSGFEPWLVGLNPGQYWFITQIMLGLNVPGPQAPSSAIAVVSIWSLHYMLVYWLHGILF